MTKNTDKIIANTPAEAKANFPKDKEYMFVFDRDGYQGVLTRELLGSLTDKSILKDSLHKVQPIHKTNLLQKVIPLSLNTLFDLPVLDKTGELKGRLEAKKLADVLSPE